jgi:hypothetical protein
VSALLKVLKASLALLLLAIVTLDAWGYFTQGTLTPASDPLRDPAAIRVVMVFGATGSVGDGLLKAAIEDPSVERIYVVTRRSSPRIDEAVASGRAEMILHQDFTDYAPIADILPDVNTVMWGLGTSSLKVDPETYTRIHVDFPVSFVEAWLAARTDAPMAFHYVTGMGTGEGESARWALDKGRAERLVAEMAEGTGLRTFGYRSAYIRPTSEQAGPMAYLGEWLLRPGKLVIPAIDLGRAMLEISMRTDELPNGSIIDNGDSLAFAAAYLESSTPQ